MAPGWEFDSAVTFERGENLRMSDERWKIKICIGWVPDFLSCISWIPQAKLSWIPDSLTWGGSFPHTHQTEWSIENITCIITKGILSLNFEEIHLHKTSFLPKFAFYLHFFTTCTCSCYPAKRFSIQQCLKLMVIHSSKRVKLAKKRVKLWVSCSHGWVEV